MKKSRKAEVVLSSNEVQAARLNKLEYTRLERHTYHLENRLQKNLTEIHHQEQGLRYYYKNVVRVIKTNRPYQIWRAAHIEDFLQEETDDLLKTFKQKRNQSPKLEFPSTLSTCSSATSFSRPLLLLVGKNEEKEKTINDFLMESVQPTNFSSSIRKKGAKTNSDIFDHNDFESCSTSTIHEHGRHPNRQKRFSFHYRPTRSALITA